MRESRAAMYSGWVMLDEGQFAEPVGAATGPFVGG